MWLLGNLKLCIGLPLYFYWTTLVCRKDSGVYGMILVKPSPFYFAVATSGKQVNYTDYQLLYQKYKV